MQATHRSCSAPGCDRPQHARGYCDSHYRRLLKTGDPLSSPIADRSHYGTPCLMPECDRANHSNGYCDLHGKRVWRHGDPTVIPPNLGNTRAGAQRHNWRGRDITYKSAHTRVRATRGSASVYQCSLCPRPAEDWSYDYGDPHEMTDENGRPFSPDIDRYRPLCRSCHRRHDFVVSTARATSRTPDHTATPKGRTQ